MGTLSEERRDEILDLLEKNHSIREIVKKVNLTPANQRQLLKICEA